MTWLNCAGKTVLALACAISFTACNRHNDTSAQPTPTNQKQTQNAPPNTNSPQNTNTPQTAEPAPATNAPAQDQSQAMATGKSSSGSSQYNPNNNGISGRAIPPVAPVPLAPNQVKPAPGTTGSTGTAANGTTGTTGQIPTVQQVEAALPPISAYDTYGGQLLTGYLSQQVPDAEVVHDVFGDDGYVLSNIAEMSLAVRQMQKDGVYTPADSERVKVLEGAMTDYLNARVQSDQNLATAVQYGTALTLGVIGGLNADRIVGGVRRVAGPLVATPLRKGWQFASNLGSKAADSIGGVGNWVKSQGAKVGDSGAAATVRDKSTSLFRRAMALVASRGGNFTTQERVVRDIARALSSPVLADGFVVSKIPEAEIEGAARLVYYPTGILGFRINQMEGQDFLTVRALNAEGGFDYFQVRGNAISALTANGEQIAIPEQTMLGLVLSRLKHFGDNTGSFVGNTAQRAREEIVNSKPYQYVTTNPQFRERLTQTAVGGSVGVLTLLALKSVDPSELTLNGYVQDLRAQGIHLEDFPLREQAYNQAATTNAAAMQ